MISRNKQIILITGLLVLSLPAFSQKKIRLENADFFEGGRKDGEKFNKFTGHVHFLQGSTEIWCDSAYFYKKENRLDANGHVRIFDTEDSVNIISRRLEYDGDSQFAQLRDNVVYREDSIVLYTDYLDYNIYTRSAIYKNGGRMNDGENILTSRKGYYDAVDKTMAFKNKVVLRNPENNLLTDSLFYDMVTRIAITVGPTEIISSDGSVVQSEEGGKFNMRYNQTTIASGEIETESYVLKGDKLFYDRDNGINRARGHVYMYFKEDNIIITGESADNNKQVGLTTVYGDPMMKKVFEGDTLYLSADTLVNVDDSLDAKKRLLAYHNVKFYRVDLQGKADSLSYFLADSTLYMYTDPVLWSEGNQIEADSIHIVFENNQISTLNLKDNSFMILQDTVKNFNQLKGKNMTGHFVDNDIQTLNVDGNSESLFYALDDKDSSLVGINKTVCSNMTIRFVNNKADNISFYKNVESTFIPPHELKEEDKQLKGFNWREPERPTLGMVLREPGTRAPEVPQEKKGSQGNPVGDNQGISGNKVN